MHDPYVSKTICWGDGRLASPSRWSSLGLGRLLGLWWVLGTRQKEDITETHNSWLYYINMCLLGLHLVSAINIYKWIAFSYIYNIYGSSNIFVQAGLMHRKNKPFLCSANQTIASLRFRCRFDRSNSSIESGHSCITCPDSTVNFPLKWRILLDAFLTQAWCI